MQSPSFELNSKHSFQQTGLHPVICSLIKHNKFQIPTPIQYNSIKTGIANKDYNLICQSKSGTGKTLSFIALMLQHFVMFDQLDAKTYCVVVVPTRELAVQIYQILRMLLDSVKQLHVQNGQDKCFVSLFRVLNTMLSIGGLPF